MKNQKEKKEVVVECGFGCIRLSAGVTEETHLQPVVAVCRSASSVRNCTIIDLLKAGLGLRYKGLV